MEANPTKQVPATLPLSMPIGEMTPEQAGYTALHLLAYMNKSGLTAAAGFLPEYADAEGYDTAALTAMAAKLRYFAETLEKSAKGKATAEVMIYGRDGVTRHGVKLVASEYVRYDYANNAHWNELNEVVGNATAARKVHERYLDTCPHEGRVRVDEQTGEAVRDYPPVRIAQDIIKATIL
ncbi:hypothetical protein [Rudanella lutea]|uniref:hypothetical protein n=1 Tax=Rudanella lutea TaxID=451374 RepID=UPI0003679D03|nr:hypothetical protein [Rudanella lutea]